MIIIIKCSIKHFTEGKTDEGQGRRRRRKQLLDELKGKGYHVNDRNTPHILCLLLIK